MNFYDQIDKGSQKTHNLKIIIKKVNFFLN